MIPSPPRVKGSFFEESTDLPGGPEPTSKWQSHVLPAFPPGHCTGAGNPLAQSHD